MNKTKKHIILQINNTGVYYNSTEFVDWKNTNFPDKDCFGISEARKIYWLVEMKNYSKITGSLVVEVKQYTNLDSSNFKDQQPKSAINAIQFNQLDWEQLKSIFNYYKSQQFEETDLNFLAKEKTINTPEPIEEHLQFEFDQSLAKITFKMGYVETEKRLKGVSNKTLIKIYNPHIIPEFEYIKFYFSKIFGSRRIKIKGSIADKNDRSTYKFTSPEIASIDESMINGIKRLEVKRKISKPPIIAVDKSLFTPEEYFDGFEGEKGNNIRKSDQELLKEILELKGVRNKKQLQYIAGSLQSENERIHFTLTPQFGFLFYVAGEDMHHYIWELLDSHATYLWSKDKEYSRTDFLKLVSRKINYIRDQGRTSYLSHEHNEELIFSKINHDSAGSALIDGFPKWRKRLNEKLV